MSTAEHEEIDEIGTDTNLRKAIGRTIPDAFFPVSPVATTRASIVSSVLAEILGARPKGTSTEDLRRALFEEHVKRTGEKELQLVWSAFLDAYAIAGETRGGEGKTAQQYLIPFHPTIAMCMRLGEVRSFGKWYRMLMSDGKPPKFDADLHARLVDRLRAFPPSNLYERLIVAAAERVGYEPVPALEAKPIRPHVPELSVAFRNDLGAWLSDESEAPSAWLEAFGDLVCFYFMMSYVQLARNLHEEFSAAKLAMPHSPSVVPIPYGLWDERATEDRGFALVWKLDDRDALAANIFDSWGRLAALRIIGEAARDAGWVGSTPTLVEAQRQLPENAKRISIERLKAALALVRPGGGSSSENLPVVANELADAITRHYRAQPKQNQTPFTLGNNVVIQLGEGTRHFIRRQRAVGVTFRLDTDALVLFAKLFRLQADTPRYDLFLDYLRARGIDFDHQSEQYAMSVLEGIGMIERHSDSGEAVYVRAI